MSRGFGFRELVPLDLAVSEAVKRISHRPASSLASVSEALGRYLAQDIYSRLDVPPFDRSVVDGYAVRSADTFGASPSSPSILRVRGAVRVGFQPPPEALGEGEAYEIQTGAPMPPGADAVVMYENTRREGDLVEVYRPVPPMANVSRRGEDLKAGEKILSRGVRLAPWDLGVLASAGFSRIPVYTPKVSVVCTGAEVVDLEDLGDQPPPPGVVINSTRHAVEGLLRGMGFDPVYEGILPDDSDKIFEKLSNSLARSDAAIVIGGSSVGTSDATAEAVARLSPELMIRGIAIRPGRPTGVAVKGGKPVFMLSGFPVAAITGFEALARPLLLHMVGASEDPRPTVRGILVRRISTPVNTRCFVRVRIYRGGDGRNYIEPLALTGSGILSTLVRGNGFLVVPENREGFDEGDEVEAILLRPLEGSPQERA